MCINEYDINPDIAGAIERMCSERGIPVLGRIRHSEEVVKAMIARKSVVEHTSGPVAADLRKVWEELKGHVICA